MKPGDRTTRIIIGIITVAIVPKWEDPFADIGEGEHSVLMYSARR